MVRRVEIDTPLQELLSSKSGAGWRVQISAPPLSSTQIMYKKKNILPSDFVHCPVVIHCEVTHEYGNLLTESRRMCKV